MAVSLVAVITVLLKKNNILTLKKQQRGEIALKVSNFKMIEMR